MLRYFFLLVVLYPIYSFCQDESEYNKIYTKTYLETSQKDFNKALEIADSLFSISKTPYLQTKSLMLSAALYQQAGDLNKSVEFALKSETIINKTDNYIWKSKVAGFLATQYRLLNIFDQSKDYLDKALYNTHKIKDKSLTNSTMGMLLQEYAFNKSAQNKYKEAIQHLNESQNYFEEVKQNRNFLLAQNEQLIGLNYHKLQDYDKSYTHLNKALEHFGDAPDNYLKGLIYNTFANHFIEREKLEEAKSYLDKAEIIAKSSNYLELKKEVYKTSKLYFGKVKDMDNFLASQEKQDSVHDEINQQKNSFINKTYTTLSQKNQEIEKETYYKNKLIIGVFLLMVSLFGYFIYYRRKQIKHIKQITQILFELDQNSNSSSKKEEIKNKLMDGQLISSELGQKENESTLIMPAVTEQKILANLEKFEEAELYTKNTISLSSLATYCETNTKYLSHVINSHKEKDFNNYINDLRVNYIIKKLKEDAVYRKYKIATLAEEAGFSSQNKFATVFKKNTSISPSVFIKYLE